jgi:hypothetical protein
MKRLMKRKNALPWDAHSAQPEYARWFMTLFYWMRAENGPLVEAGTMIKQREQILVAGFLCSVVVRTVRARSRRKQQIRKSDCGEDHPSQARSSRCLLDMDAAKGRVKSIGKNDGRHQRPQNADDESEASRQDDEDKHEPEWHKQPEVRMGKETGDNESCCQTEEKPSQGPQRNYNLTPQWRPPRGWQEWR